MYVSEKVYFPQEKLQNFQNTFKPGLGKADCKVFWELKAGSNRIKPYSNKNKNHLLTCVPVVVCVFVLLCRPSQAPEEWARGPTGDVSTPEVNVMLSLRPTSAGTLPQATQLQREDMPLRTTANSLWAACPDSTIISNDQSADTLIRSFLHVVEELETNHNKTKKRIVKSDLPESQVFSRSSFLMVSRSFHAQSKGACGEALGCSPTPASDIFLEQINIWSLWGGGLWLLCLCRNNHLVPAPFSISHSDSTGR